MDEKTFEDEIDLRDYLNVIWKKRRLILAVVLVSLISSVYYSYFVLQDEYLSEAKLAYIPNKKITLPESIEFLKSQSTLNNINIENIKNTNLILIQIKGNEPKIIKSDLEQYLDLVIDMLNKQALKKSLEEYSQLDNKSIRYAKYAEEINEQRKQIIAKEAAYEIKRLENELNKTTKNESRKDLEFKISEMKSIMDNTAPLSVLEKYKPNNEINLLNSKLNSIYAKFSEIEIQKLEFEGNDTQVVELMSSKTSAVISGPKRGLNISIAAILGLFVGVFAAFFMNYLEETASDRNKY